MKYKLYKGSNSSDLIERILKNRGIEDVNTYLNLNENVLIPYSKLNNISKAAKMFVSHFNNKSKIEILVDTDPDGYCSAAMLYLYIKRLDKDYPVSYIMHTIPKAHGLSDIKVQDDTKLLIVPDAGTNDTAKCEELFKTGREILILDHHEAEQDNPYATIVNNQSSENYYNKDLCGAGVVYKFLKALDEEMWNEIADDYLDLCALANIGDVMDLRSFETRYLVDTGISNIKNKCIKALIDAQEYSMRGKINIHNIQWSIIPILNGMIRVGSYEEKELLFRAFIEQDEFFEYKKRATKEKPAETIQESIYERAARLCKNAKARQDKMREKGVRAIMEIADNLPPNDKVVVVDTTDILDAGLTGVVAIKIAERYNKPCILLKKHRDKETGAMVYGGSARNVNHSPIENLKEVINSTGIINGQGHASAFGIIALPVEDKERAIMALNSMLKDVEYDSTYNVDFILDVNEVTIPLIIKMSEFENIICQGIEDPLVAIENISLTRDCFEIFGKNEDTISFEVNGIKYIQFKCKNNNRLYNFLQDAWNDEDSVVFNLVGKPSINDFGGLKTPQVIIEDINVIATNTINEEDDW